MTNEPLHLFLNPTAGRGRTGQRREQILALLSLGRVGVELHISRAMGDLESQVAEQVGAGARRIVVAGGDGSIHEAVNALMRSGSDAALGIIPTGTGNDFAKACRIPLNWEHATQLMVERITTEATLRTIDVGKCNDRYFANGAGIGFDARVTRTARSIRLPIGDLVYLLAIFKTMIGGIATPDLSIEADGYTWNGPLTLASISNGPWVGGMFHIAPMADNADNKLELLIAKPVGRLRILSLLPKLMSGSHLDEPEIIHRSVRELDIQAAEPIPSHLDGEVQPLQSSFKLAVVPGALRLL
jgi:diacylglycerol kinase (ATP)